MNQHDNNYIDIEYSCGSRDVDDDSMDDVSILVEDGEQEQERGRQLPRPESFEITPEDQERFNSILPPVYQVCVPAVRRRAHTVDVEFGGCGRVLGSSSSSSGEDNDDEEEDDGVYHQSPVHHYHRSSKCSDDDTSRGHDDDDDDDSAAASLSSLEQLGGDLLLLGEGQRRRQDGRRVSATAVTSAAAAAAAAAARSHQQRGSLRFSLSEEGRQRRRRQRQKLVNSRCMRGFAALCVYGILVLQPSTTTLMETGVPTPFEEQSSLAAVFNSTTPATASSRRAQLVLQETPPRVANIDALPKFHHLGPSTSSRRHPLPPQHHPIPQQHPAYHSTMPPNAINSITKTNGTITRWHKIPPDPPTIYHKKQRPILSHAHSYQLHQEPLVFGREQKTSFLLDDGGGSEDNNNNNRENSSGDGKRRSWRSWWIPLSLSSSSSSTLIWFSLVCLLMDTSYREWQHYSWHRRFLDSTTTAGMGAPLPQTLSAMQRRQRRSLHYRRSPSPEPPRRRFDSY